MARTTAKSKAPKSTKTVPTTPPKRPPGLRAKLFTPRLLLAAALIPLCLWGLGRLGRIASSLRDRPEYGVGHEAVEVVDAPPWIPRDFAGRTMSEADFPDRLPLLSESLVEDVAGAFARSPWVAHVTRVRKTADRRIVVELEFREPVAVVRVGRVTYPIDEEAVRLPAEDLPPAEMRRLPTIVDVRTRPRRVGSAWGDSQVAAAARVAAAVAAKWEDFSLEAIRTRTVAGGVAPADPVFELVAHGGTVVVWGRDPASHHPGELSPEQKVGRLEKYLADFGSFDRPHGPYEIDIRHWREISRRPLRVGSDARSPNARR